MEEHEMRYAIRRSEDALIIVDVQRDFCSGGALPVPEGEKIIPTLNRYIKKFSEAGALIIATRDWHPPNHVSFVKYGGPWPPHCVQGTPGAEFHPDLKLPRNIKIVSKATSADKEAYSGFNGTGLGAELRKAGIRRVFVGGLATDYCVKSTVLDALSLGFETVLLLDAIKGVNVNPGDSEKAINEMLKRGARKAVIDDFQSCHSS
ncbi:MAG: hypothetical protein AYL33_000860 [Candidatus Bathyarchaeota archaeon B63]|nr:MAG: hypothetical protein AYL33_000860 [Candidatus Bathyarchaeota archaeon B63]